MKPLAYEDSVPAVVGQKPQTTVDSYMREASKSDIVICILWHRMGTPVIDEETGKQFQSGMEYEFMDAYRSNQRFGTPHILLYRCTRRLPENTDPNQFQRVQDFFKRFEGEHAELKGLYKLYRSYKEFEEILFHDLETIISKNLIPSHNLRTGQISITYQATRLLHSSIGILTSLYMRRHNPSTDRGSHIDKDAGNEDNEETDYISTRRSPYRVPTPRSNRPRRTHVSEAKRWIIGTVTALLLVATLVGVPYLILQPHLQLLASILSSYNEFSGEWYCKREDLRCICVARWFQSGTDAINIGRADNGGGKSQHYISVQSSTGYFSITSR